MLSQDVYSALVRREELSKQFGHGERFTTAQQTYSRSYFSFNERRAQQFIIEHGPLFRGRERVCLVDWYKKELGLLFTDSDYAKECAVAHVFLARMNELCADQVPVAYRVDRETTLVMGASWWASVGELVSKEKPFFGLPAYPGEEFPHLRIFKHPRQRLLEVDTFEHVFPKLLRPNLKSSDEEPPYCFRIGLHTLRDSPATKFDCTEQSETTVRFFAQPCTSTSEHFEKYKQALQQTVEWAKDKKIHLLCLPELSVCATGQNVLREALSQIKPDQLSYIIPGSFHFERGGRKTNSSAFWRVKDDVWKCVAEVEKYEYFTQEAHNEAAKGPVPIGLSSVRKTLREDIAGGDEHVRFATPFGLLSIAICKDFMASSIGRAKHPANDHVICVSMLDSPKAVIYHKELSGVGIASFFVNAAHSLAIAEKEVAGVPLAFWEWPRIVRSANDFLANFGLSSSGRVEAPARETARANGPWNEEWLQTGGIYCDIPIPEAYVKDYK